MDAKNAFEAIEAIRATVPVEDQAGLDAEYATRFGVIGEAVGTVAVAETAPAPETQLEKKLPDFLNPDIKLGAKDQLTLMREFWNDLGYVVPDLSSEQETRLEATVDSSLGSRVVPTPLLDLTGRMHVAASASELFKKNSFHPDCEALRAPGTSYTYGKLMANPESTVKVGRKEYGLRYKTPDGEIVSRASYIESLVSAGQAVVAEDGTVWTFPVMDVRMRAPRTRNYAAKLLERISAVSTPESLITMQLLHQANGTPNSEWEVDFANEAVYELDKNGKLVALVSVTSVDWDPDSRQLYLDDWDAGSRNDNFGVRAEKSGL